LCIFGHFRRCILRKNKKQNVVVSVEEGSFKLIVTLALLAVNIVKAEINTLHETNDLGSIGEKRGNIIENWSRNCG